MSYLSRDALLAVGFSSVGDDVLVSDRASVHNPAGIEIGSHVRIDDFCLLSAGRGGIRIGSYVHVACYVSMIGAGRIVISDCANVAARTTILSASDDFSGAFLIGPTAPADLRNVVVRDVTVGPRAIIGVGAVLLPGASVGADAAVGALALVKAAVPDRETWGGVPARRVAARRCPTDNPSEGWVARYLEWEGSR